MHALSNDRRPPRVALAAVTGILLLPVMGADARAGTGDADRRAKPAPAPGCKAPAFAAPCGRPGAPRRLQQTHV